MSDPSHTSLPFELKQYEFQVFDRIISGDLSPFNTYTNIPPNYLKLLDSENSNYFQFTIANYKNQNGKLKYKNQRAIFCLHPAAIKIRANQPTLFDIVKENTPDKVLLKELNIHPTKVSSFTYSKSSNNITLYIQQKSEIEHYPSNQLKLFYYSKLLYEEVERIKIVLKNNVIKCDIEEQTQHYIHKQQHALSSLLIQLHKILAPSNFKDIYNDELEYTSYDIINLTYSNLEHLIRFLEKNFLKFIDTSIEIEHRTALIKFYGLDYKFKKIKTHLLNSQLNPQTVQTLLKPFSKIDSHIGSDKLTYKTLNYFNTYSTYILDYLKHISVVTDEKLFDLLVSINYNSVHILSLFVDSFIKALNKITSRENKLDYLYRELKNLKQVHLVSQLAYNSNMPNLKDEISAWLQEEIQYYSRKIQLSPSTSSVPSKSNVVSKISTGLSVSQISYFFKLMSDVGVIDHKNQRDIFRHISENYSTSKTSEISIDSINSKFYSPDSAAIESIRGKLIEMLNKTKSD